ncbi:MAG TPA: YbjN domain-containing protein [Caulobacteraceae bacterium]|jgi:hypothetical protein
MHLKLVALGAALTLASALAAAPASAQTAAAARGGAIPASGLTAAEIADWLRGDGFSAVVKPDPTTAGDQIISTSVDGVDVDIYVYDCSGDGDGRRCTSMQYAAGWAPSGSYSADKTNEWNRTHRYIKAYLTRGNSLYGEYDLDLSPGGTFEMLNDTLVNWRSTARDFKTYFGV